MRRDQRRGLALTVCPLSNGVVTAGTKATEIKRMLNQGLRVTVNSDDPAYFGGYITENLLAVQREAGLTQAEIVQLAHNAFAASWLPSRRKDAYLAELEAFTG